MNKTVKSVLEYLKLHADVFIKSTLVYIFTRLLIRVSYSLSYSYGYGFDEWKLKMFEYGAVPVEMLPAVLAGVCAIVLFSRKN